MKLTLATYGGLAAGLRRAPVVIDSAALPAADAAQLRELVRAAEAAAAASAAAPARGRGRPKPDAQSYVVQVEEDGRTFSLRGSDLGSDPAFAALHEWIARHSGG